MSAKLCLITGASAGLGRATAARLAAMEEHVVMVCRNQARGEAVRNEITSQTKNKSIDLMVADLSSLASVRNLAGDFEGRYSRLDVLVNNAAVTLSSRTVTPEGFEQMFATNYLGPFLLSRLLIPYLEAGKPSRIINVTAPSTTRPDLDDLQGERKFSAMNAFGASKASDLLFTYVLARKLAGRGVMVNAYHPGVMKTELNRTAPTPIRLVGGVLNVFVGKTPERASEGLVELATSAQFADTNGQLIHGGKAIDAPFIEDTELQDRLWKASCNLVGVEESV